MPLAPIEEKMWDGGLAPLPTDVSNAKIDAKYEIQGRKLVLESNRPSPTDLSFPCKGIVTILSSSLQIKSLQAFFWGAKPLPPNLA